MKSKASKFCGGALTCVMALLGLAGSAFFALLVLLIPVNVLAVSMGGDTVVPSSYATSLKPGQSVTITKTVTISAGTPTSAKVDIFFLADTTGSMGETLAAVKSGAAEIMAGTSGLGDVAYGVGEYKDFNAYDPFVYRLNQDITDNKTDVQNGINAWVASGGEDWAEGQLYALYQVASNVAWREGSTRIIIWFGDAPGHDPSVGVNEAQATAALVAQTIKVMALNVPTSSGDPGELDYYGQAQSIADATGGTYYPTVIISQIVDDIQNAIINSFQTYSTVRLGTSMVPTGLTVNVVPPSYMGAYDRSMDRIFTFDVTFTAVSPGSYSFTIPVLVDGGTMATEQDNIQVGGLLGLGFPLPGLTPFTAPVSAVMDNSVLERIPIEFYVPANVIKAFNGEIGKKQYGFIYLDPYGLYWPAYKNSTGTDFFPPSIAGVRPLNYINGAYLSYAGNPGYNYDVPAGTPVLATADGKLYKAVIDPVNGAGYDYYQNSYIDHQNGYYSWYLYAPLTPAILAEISANPDGYAQVTRGQIIGHVAAADPSTIKDRLHFEVRYNGIDHQNVVDPYKLGLWLPNAAHLEGLLLLLLDDDAPPQIGY
ncbi:MAG: peptidoglycan DD-metalloendopeptidase family protein [Deltaproteobacteria bacterium]|nr:peptidoglycan DD-metalloendopeptidase family protein [Deltaproteobacteria bacterium]